MKNYVQFSHWVIVVNPNDIKTHNKLRYWKEENLRIVKEIITQSYIAARHFDTEKEANQFLKKIKPKHKELDSAEVHKLTISVQ